MGGGIGWIWRGRWAVVPVALVHAIGAGFGQYLATAIDTWRLKESISRLQVSEPLSFLHNHTSDPADPSSDIAARDIKKHAKSLWEYNIDTSLKKEKLIKSSKSGEEDGYGYPQQPQNWRTQYLDADPNDASLLDPVKSIFDNIAALIGWWGVSDTDAGSGNKDWEWVQNATNVEYRKKLGYKVVLLKEQIQELRKELRERGIDYNQLDLDQDATRSSKSRQ